MDEGDVHEHLSAGRGFAYDDNDFCRLERLIDQNDDATAEELIEMMGSSAPYIDETTMRWIVLSSVTLGENQLYG